MIKLIVLILFFLSCSKSEFADLSSKTEKRLPSLTRLEVSPKIEMMMLFVWPKQLTRDDEKFVSAIIKDSATIAKVKDDYLRTRLEVKTSYEEQNCDCVLYEICDEDETGDYDLCEELTDTESENNIKLQKLTSMHEQIKMNLKLVGATNVDVGMDDEVINIGSWSVSDKLLILNKTDDVEVAISEDLRGTAKAFISGEVFEADVSGVLNAYNAFFQGELKSKSGRSGIIYWEHLR